MDLDNRAFTQLAADNQYAHLGLALLGVLAQIDQAAGLLIPRESPPPPLQEEFEAPRREMATGEAEHPLPRAVESADHGVAVSRANFGKDEDAGGTSKTKKKDKSSSIPTRQGAGPGESMGRRSAKKASTKSKKSETNVGDEFDQLFGATSKPPKKKKRKAKDEFDHLFSSLS